MDLCTCESEEGGRPSANERRNPEREGWARARSAAGARERRMGAERKIVVMAVGGWVVVVGQEEDGSCRRLKGRWNLDHAREAPADRSGSNPIGRVRTASDIYAR